MNEEFEKGKSILDTWVREGEVVNSWSVMDCARRFPE